MDKCYKPKICVIWLTSHTEDMIGHKIRALIDPNMRN